MRAHSRTSQNYIIGVLPFGLGFHLWVYIKVISEQLVRGSLPPSLLCDPPSSRQSVPSMPAATTSGADPAAPPIDTYPRSPRPHHDPSFLHVLYDNSSHSFTPPITSSAMFNYLTHSQPSMSNSWHNHQHHHFPSNPYPAAPPPPPIAHKVWILDCRSCGTFLTNRGMKVFVCRANSCLSRTNEQDTQAVLLLRPNVPLYSSDALPVNCSAYTSNPDVLRPASSCRPAAMSQLPPRTCECLTQTLCCHCCGTTIGYMIVIPVSEIYIPFIFFRQYYSLSAPAVLHQLPRQTAQRMVTVLSFILARSSARNVITSLMNQVLSLMSRRPLPRHHPWLSPPSRHSSIPRH